MVVSNETFNETLEWWYQTALKWKIAYYQLLKENSELKQELREKNELVV